MSVDRFKAWRATTLAPHHFFWQNEWWWPKWLQCSLVDWQDAYVSWINISRIRFSPQLTVGLCGTSFMKKRLAAKTLAVPLDLEIFLTALYRVCLGLVRSRPPLSRSSYSVFFLVTQVSGIINRISPRKSCSLFRSVDCETVDGDTPADAYIKETSHNCSGQTTLFILLHAWWKFPWHTFWFTTIVNAA